MESVIETEIPGRIRVKLAGSVPDRDLDALYKVLYECPVVTKATVYPRIGGLALSYLPGETNRSHLINHLASIDEAAIERARSTYAFALAPRTHSLLMDIALLAGSYFARRWFLPYPIKALFGLWRFRHFLSAGLRSLGKAKLDVPVLDASAVGISFLKRDFSTASQTMFLLELGEIFEDYTKRRSENELINSLLDIPEYAQRIDGDEESSILATDLIEGNQIVVRTGMPIPIDGVIERGIAMVNQAVLTGESIAIERKIGDDVFAGTTVEDGEIFIRVKSNAEETKLRSIVSLVDRFSSAKSGSQSRMEEMANKIVPWNFLLAGIVALTTRNLEKTSAALMVDYSCALKLTGSIAVLSAMSQSAKLGFTVKGSRYFDEFAKADTIVFDKTGTLTEAVPEVAQVVAFDGWDEEEVLRLSACLEEHFPHPVARAVVNAAAERNLQHRERHAEVEYIVAHGIVSSLDGKRVVIGSGHFIVEDEAVEIPEEAHQAIDHLMSYSLLYLAVDGKLVGVLAIHDPIKKGAAEDIAELRSLGFKRVVMLTGDHVRSAEGIAKAAGIDEYRADMLPEDKQRYLRQLKDEGCHLVMVGDGINDSPALSIADVGVAMGQGTAIAKEVADITLANGDLQSLVTLRRLSCALIERMDNAYKSVIGFNSLLLALGIGGIIQPSLSALLHNGSTIALSMKSSAEYRIEESMPQLKEATEVIAEDEAEEVAPTSLEIDHFPGIDVESDNQISKEDPLRLAKHARAMDDGLPSNLWSSIGSDLSISADFDNNRGLEPEA